MGGTPTFVRRDGKKVTPWMDYQLGRLSAEMQQRFGVRVLVSDGVRTYEYQKAIFLARYVRAAQVNGRRVYDTRWWNGVLWYRISSAGTVAQPGTSNHEIQGSRGAVDIRDSGNDAGVTVRTSTRGKWLRQNAARFGMVASGDGFGEGWHFDMLNIFKTPPAPSGGGGTPIPTPSEEEDMFPAVLINESNPTGTYYLYDLRTQKVIRPITREENNGLRDAWKKGGAVYITAKAADFKAAGGK